MVEHHSPRAAHSRRPFSHSQCCHTCPSSPEEGVGRGGGGGGEERGRGGKGDKAWRHCWCDYSHLQVPTLRGQPVIDELLWSAWMGGEEGEEKDMFIGIIS